MKIDLVYSWVDDSDSKWREKRDREYRKSIGDNHYCQKMNSLSGRYSDHSELKYSIRSVKKYLPWVNHIFIVTDQQIPKWLNPNHPKISIVDHSVILPKWVKKPTFNSNVIAQYFSLIPGLSEQYLCMDDDCLIGKSLSPDFFFTESGKLRVPAFHYEIGALYPAIEATEKIDINKLSGKHINSYLEALPKITAIDSWVGFRNAYYLASAIYGKELPNLLLAHTPRPYRKTIQKKLNQMFIHVLEHNGHNQFRSDDDIWLGYLKIVTSIITGDAEVNWLNRNDVLEFSLGTSWNKDEKLTDALGIIFKNYIFLSISEGASSRSSWWRWLGLVLKFRFSNPSSMEIRS